jgi:hypothetical protein
VGGENSLRIVGSYTNATRECAADFHPILRAILRAFSSAFSRWQSENALESARSVAGGAELSDRRQSVTRGRLRPLWEPPSHFLFFWGAGPTAGRHIYRAGKPHRGRNHLWNIANSKRWERYGDRTLKSLFWAQKALINAGTSFQNAHLVRVPIGSGSGICPIQYLLSCGLATSPARKANESEI